jgi:hypothetical protein
MWMAALDHEGHDIHLVRHVVELAAFGVDAHQARRRDLLEQSP